MDKKQLVERLNEDLALEFQSILQYVHRIATLKGAEFQRMVVELEKHAQQEMSHALVLARQIDFLGGTPTTRVGKIETANDAREALELDLGLERRQLERYRQRVEEAAEAGLPDVVEALSPLLVETQEHVRDLEAALGG